MRILLFLIFVYSTALGQSAVDEPQDQKIEAKELKAEKSFTEAMKFYLIEDFEKANAEFRKGIQAYGENASVLFMLSKTELALNRIPAALISAKKAADLDKENFFYLQHLGNLQFKQNQYKEASATIKKALKIKPNFVEGYLNLVDIYLIEGKESDALKTLADMEETMGASEQITQAKQSILLKQNKVDAALKEGKKMVKNDPQYILQQSTILISNSRYTEAVQMLKNTIEENPNFMEAYGLLAETYAKQNNKQGTKDVLKSILAQNALPYSLKANALGSYFSSLKNNTQAEDITDALGFCEQIIAIHPDEARTYVYKADILVKSNQLLAARDAYLNAIKYDKGIFEAWLAVVELDVKLSKYGDLLKHSEKATEYYPNHSYFWYHLGFAQMQTKAYDDALISLEEAQALNTNNKELKHHINASMAEIYHQNGKIEESMELFEQVLAENPNNEQVLNNYSYLLATGKKNLDKALLLSERLVKLYPNQAANYETYAWVLFQKAEYGKANEAIELALSNDKNGSERIFELKGDILFKLGQTENAVSNWKKALELNKSNKKLENKIKDRTIVE